MTATVYDKALELTKALQETDEAKELKVALDAARNDADAKLLMEQFREQQTKLQQKMDKGQEPTTEEMESMNNLYEASTQNPMLIKCFEAEKKFSTVFDEVTKIVTESLQKIME